LIPVIPDKVRTAGPVKQASIRIPEKRLAATRQTGIGIDGEQALDAWDGYFHGVKLARRHGATPVIDSP